MERNTTRPRVLVVHESMFGNTRQVAEAITRGLRDNMDVDMIAASDPSALAMAADRDLVVIGAPTHEYGLSHPGSRHEAVRWSQDKGQRFKLETAAATTGVRELLPGLAERVSVFAAFDTRIDMPRMFTGSAAKIIDRLLRDEGCTLFTEPQSFLVDHRSRLLPRELDRAEEWGRTLGARLDASPDSATP